ncbi:MAG: hypothetical protein M0Z59_03850 [Nitrospiraceae bacterium]|nr:hypothetical protein [Nitrospiraceae bacterium]
MSNKKLVVTALLLMLSAALFSGCSKKQAVKPEPPDIKISQQAFKVIDEVKTGYEKKDDAAIKAVSTGDGYIEVTKTFGDFDTAKLKFVPKWVEITDGAVTVNIAWEGTWTKGGNTATDNGMAVFELKGTPLKFNRVIKGSPFVYPGK